MKIRIVDALKKCEDENYPITRMGLYIAGQKNGFLTKQEGMRNFEFDKDKFLEWLKKAKEQIPEDYISVKQLSTDYGINMNYSYDMAKELLEKEKARYIGSGKGVLYVDRKAVEELIAENKQKSIINWEE
jgi:hypothetical protein